MRRTVTIAGLVSLVALAVTARTLAQSSNVVITRAEAQGTHPSVGWTLAPGWCSNVLAVAKSPQTGSDGSFFSENVIDGAILDDNQTSWLSSSPSLDEPGTYYVRVQAYQCDFLAGPEWSATATIVKQPPPPPPPPPTPKVRFVVQGWNGYDTTTGNLSKVTIGQRLYVELKGSQSDRFAMRESGRLCFRTKAGNACTRYGNRAITYATTRVTKNIVVRGRVVISATYEGQTVATKALKVVARKK
jgi:hypothetical protein